MKNLLIILLAITTSIICTSEVIAQYSIPAYDVEIVADPTTFEESTSQSGFTQTNHRKPLSIQLPGSDGERQMKVGVVSKNGGGGATAVVYIYSLDEQDILGPFTVVEGTVLSQSIDEREWGVEVVSSSEGAEVSVWIE